MTGTTNTETQPFDGVLRLKNLEIGCMFMTIDGEEEDGPFLLIDRRSCRGNKLVSGMQIGPTCRHLVDNYITKELSPNTLVLEVELTAATFTNPNRPDWAVIWG